MDEGSGLVTGPSRVTRTSLINDRRTSQHRLLTLLGFRCCAFEHIPGATLVVAGELARSPIIT